MQDGRFLRATGRQTSFVNKKGFTLLELLVATAIFAFAITAILQMFISCSFLDRVNRNKSIAATHGETVVERIVEYMRSGELATLQGQVASGTWDWNTSAIGSNLGCASPYVYPCVLDNESIATSCTNGTDPLNVTVNVSWKDSAQTNTRSLSFSTLIGSR
jgi:prepilin-type N-terminal cleavage/methylation domain-containing protein